MEMYGISFFGLIVGLSIAAFGGTIAMGWVISKSVEGVARQPESRGSIMVFMIIGLALIESLVIYCLVMAFMLRGDLKRYHDEEFAKAMEQPVQTEAAPEAAPALAK